MKLYLSKSGIPKSGLGLYTMKAIPKGAKICDYTGKLVSAKAWNDGGEGEYGLHINKNTVLDARSTQSALGRYANDCRNRNKKKKDCKGKMLDSL